MEFPPSVPTSPAARLVLLVVLLAMGFFIKKILPPSGNISPKPDFSLSENISPKYRNKLVF